MRAGTSTPARLSQRLNGLNNFGGYFPQYRALNESHCTTIVDFKNGDIQAQNLQLRNFIDSVLDGQGKVLDASEQSDQADRAKPFNLLYWLVDQLLGWQTARRCQACVAGLAADLKR